LYFLENTRKDAKLSFSFELLEKKFKTGPAISKPILQDCPSLEHTAPNIYKTAFPQNALLVLTTLVFSDSAIPNNGQQLQLSFGCIWDLFWSQCNIRVSETSARAGDRHLRRRISELPQKNVICLKIMV
jgi:hypothetical protein